jgi:hypothetical protein
MIIGHLCRVEYLLEFCRLERKKGRTCKKSSVLSLYRRSIIFLVVVTEAPAVATSEAPAPATEALAPATEGLLIEEVQPQLKEVQPQLEEVQPQPEEAALPREEEQTTEPLPFISDIVEGKLFYHLICKCY